MAGSFDVLQGLVIAVDTKDRYTKRHSEDVARYASSWRDRMGLDDETQRTFQLAGLLHDVGKIGIPDSILRKPGALTDEEFAMFQQHPALGDAIVRAFRVELVRAGIRHHHERWDGGGYPEGLEGEAIPLMGRILAVADAFSDDDDHPAVPQGTPADRGPQAPRRRRRHASSRRASSLHSSTGIETAADAPVPGEEPTQLWRRELWVA